MGIIITKFKKKKTTYEILEKLENDIQSIEEFRRSTEQTQKKMVGRFIFISVCVYCITAFIFYFYFFPASAYDRIIYIIPLIILPVLLIFIKRILTWYYNRKIRKNQKKLTDLKDEKKKILEEVMDKETYKVAKTILDKFAPEQVKKNTFATNDSTPIRQGPLFSAGSTSMMPSQTGLRYRGQFGAAANNLSLGPVITPRPRPIMPAETPALGKTPQVQSIVSTAGRPVGPGVPLLLPRAILPRERTVLDKMVDYLVGDGPSNRYALICKNCSSHNGMALKEEFDYLSFRCCYCMAFNPARKKRPAAPKLNVSLAIKSKSDATDSERNSPTDTDSDSEDGSPIVTEPDHGPLDESKLTFSEKICNLSDVDKLSDVDVKSSDTESSAMEIDLSAQSSEESLSRKCDTNKSENEINTEFTQNESEIQD